jgi:hypothetical protein
MEMEIIMLSEISQTQKDKMTYFLSYVESTAIDTNKQTKRHKGKWGLMWLEGLGG